MKTLLACILLVIAISPVYSQDSTQLKTAPWFVQRFKVSAGLFIPVNNTNIQVGLTGTVRGTEIDFEDDLGFNKTSVTFLGDLQWRASRRSRFDFSYYFINRKSTHTLDRDLIFGEDTFHVNNEVSSFFNTPIFRISYGYALLARPKFEAGLLVGVHVVGTKVGMSLSGAVSGERSTDFNVTAPLPDFGIWGGYEFSKHFALNAEADYFALTINDITGKIVAYDISLTYRILESFRVALGYSGLDCKVDAVKDNLTGNFKWGYNGPVITATYTFGRKKWLTD